MNGIAPNDMIKLNPDFDKDLPVRVSARKSLRRLIRRWVPWTLRGRIVSALDDCASILARRRRYSPKEIKIELSTACNRSCSYCPQSLAPQKQRFINSEILDVIIYRLQEFKWDGHINFGFFEEPLLSPHFESQVQKIHDSLPHCVLNMFTNGDKLTRSVFERLTQAGLSSFIVNRHPPYSDEWDSRILELCKLYPDRIQITELRDNNLHNRGGLVRDLLRPNVMAGAKFCRAPECVVISIDGDVLLCCDDYNHENILGSLVKSRLDEIYYGKRATYLRQQLRNGNFNVTGMCRKCVLDTNSTTD